MNESRLQVLVVIFVWLILSCSSEPKEPSLRVADPSPVNESCPSEDMIDFEAQEEEDAFSIDQCLVTNGQYKECVDMGACTELKETEHYNNENYQNPDHPVVEVTWVQADQYCNYREGKRLPSTIEWKRAKKDHDFISDDKISEWTNKSNLKKPGHKMVISGDAANQSYGQDIYLPIIGFRCAKSK